MHLKPNDDDETNISAHDIILLVIFVLACYDNSSLEYKIEPL